MRIATLISILLLVVTGCASQQQISGDIGETKWAPSRYYNESREAQSAGDYKTSIKYLSELEITYPFTPYGQLAPLEMAFGHYKLNEFDQAISEANRFIEYYPNHPNMDYALYLKGLIRSTQGNLPLPADTNVDQMNPQIQHKREAFQHFSEVVKQFPDSRYSESAKQYMQALRTTLAQYELIQVEEHMDAGDTTTAMDRAKYISENYANTPAAGNAADLLIQSQGATLVTPSGSVIVPKEVAQLDSQRDEKNTPKQKTPYREEWLLAQNPEHYTIQITATSNKYWLDTFIEQKRLQNDIAYFKRTRQGKDWYAVLYGHYNNYAEASAAAKELQGSLNIKDSWVRQYKDIQTSIQKANLEQDS